MFEILPPRRTTIMGTFRIKIKSNGTIGRFKAPLVAKGLPKTHGLDYTEAFAPTMWAESIRIIFSIAAAEGLFMVQFDIKAAHLNSTIHEIIFMELSYGFETISTSVFLGAVAKFVASIKVFMAWSSLLAVGILLFPLSWKLTICFRVVLTPVFSSQPQLLVFSSIFGLMMAWPCVKIKALLTKTIAHLQTVFEVTVGNADVYIGLHIMRDTTAHGLYIDH